MGANLGAITNSVAQATPTQPTDQSAGGMPPTNAPAASSNSQYDPFLTSLYQQDFNRAPDTAGLQYWEQQLASGKSQQDVTNDFLNSSEYQSSHPQAATPSATPAVTGPYAQNPYDVTGANATNLQSSTNPYIQAAQQTSLGNLAGAQNATAANRVNQSTPYSNLNYTQTGTDANGNPIWSANQTLAGPLAGAQSSLAQGVANQAAQGFNPNTPSVGINPGQLYSDAIMQRLQPQQAHAQEQQAASLANQGIAPGTDAYNNAMRTFQQGQNDQLTSAQVGGIGVGLQANQQAFNQQLQQANLQNGLFGLGSSAILGAGGLGNLGTSAINGYNWLTGLGTNAANNTMSQVNQGLLSPTAGGSIYNSLPGIDTSLTQGMVG